MTVSPSAVTTPPSDPGPLDERVRRAEAAVIRRDERVREQLAEASLQGQRAIRGGGKYVLGGAGVMAAVWLAFRRKHPRPPPVSHRRGEAEATAKTVKTAKSAGVLGAIGAVVSLISTLVQAANGAQRLGIPWGSLGRDAMGLVRRRPAVQPATTSPVAPTVPAAAAPVAAVAAADLSRRRSRP